MLSDSGLGVADCFSEGRFHGSCFCAACLRMLPSPAVQYETTRRDSPRDRPRRLVIFAFSEVLRVEKKMQRKGNLGRANSTSLEKRPAIQGSQNRLSKPQKPALLLGNVLNVDAYLRTRGYARIFFWPRFSTVLPVTVCIHEDHDGRRKQNVFCVFGKFPSCLRIYRFCFSVTESVTVNCSARTDSRV